MTWLRYVIGPMSAPSNPIPSMSDQPPSEPVSHFAGRGLARPGDEKRLLGIHPLKWVFALEYVLQGMANPFQGITYQPFFGHFKFEYGLSEAATQKYFAQSYLAWSFKPILGFFIDAYGRTRTLLLFLLGASAIGFVLTPLIDRGPMLFFSSMFALSVILAATDVAVDRATVIEGTAEAAATGKSKATSVGLNQAICWTAIYGTSIVASLLGGYIADHVSVHALLVGLALVPMGVFLATMRLPKDRLSSIPIRRSVAEFWHGLNSGPILTVMAFSFIFNFQPAMGALWTHYQITELKFSQTHLGIADAASSVGALLGVLLFAFRGVRWQDRLGLRRIFCIYIVASVFLGFTQYLMLEPWFSRATDSLQVLLPFVDRSVVRLGFLILYGLVLAIPSALIRMSTFSLVGAVIPVAAAGSLFAGFMSVANLASSFAYSSGAWLYEHGLEHAFLRDFQQLLFGIPARSGEPLALGVLVFINSVSVLASLLCVHWLPDRRATLDTGTLESAGEGPERWVVLPSTVRRGVNAVSLAGGLALLCGAILLMQMAIISSAIACFLLVALLRRSALNLLTRRCETRSPAQGR